MDLRLLNYFIVLTEEMNYRKAAERLFITQPTLSQQIKLLEEKMGFALFLREKNQLSLTPEGELLKTEAYRLLAEASASFQRMESYHHKLNDEIIIGSTGLNMLTQPIYEFSQFYPEIKIRAYERSHNSIKEMVISGETDIGLAYVSRRSDENLNYLNVGDDSFLCIVPENHMLATETAIPLHALLPYPLILTHERLAARKFLRMYEIQNNLNFFPLYEMANYTPCLDFVKRGLGVSVLPHSFIKNYAEEGFRIISINDFDEKLNVALMHRRDKSFTLYEEKFIEMIQKYAL